MCKSADFNRIDMKKYDKVVAALLDPANAGKNNRQLMGVIGCRQHNTIERYRRLMVALNDNIVPDGVLEPRKSSIKIREGCWLKPCGCTTAICPANATTRGPGPNREMKRDNTKPSKYPLSRPVKKGKK